ncbi:hypothetical protein QBC47DRAFT_360026 [Echria macrotheca]|uniref:Uncharacterized protein n=1 Tax=Echria macrotheca TaxID=438768 RepID=A0AAJ0FAH6_9PEZI|nr:hypothetical protein QBC47DRAFT_360026 [Echria macrotheca]
MAAITAGTNDRAIEGGSQPSPVAQSPEFDWVAGTGGPDSPEIHYRPNWPMNLLLEPFTPNPDWYGWDPDRPRPSLEMEGFGGYDPEDRAEATSPSRYGPHSRSYHHHHSSPAASSWANGVPGASSGPSSAVALPMNGLPSLPPSEEARGGSNRPAPYSAQSLSSSASTHRLISGSAASGSPSYHPSPAAEDTLAVLRNSVLVMQDEMQFLRETLFTTIQEKEEMRQHVGHLDGQVRNLRDQVARMEAAAIEARQNAVASAARLEEMERALARSGAHVQKLEKDDDDWDDEEALPMMYVRALAKGKDLARST